MLFRSVVDGEFVFVSGTTGYDYATMTMPDEVADQARTLFKTVADVLDQAGSAMEQITRIQIFVTDHAYCEPVLKICGEGLGAIRPASGIYVVSALLKAEMKVEIEVTARRR